MSQNSEIEIPKRLRPYGDGDGKFYINDVWDELEGPPNVLVGMSAGVAPAPRDVKPNKYGAATAAIV